MCSLYNKAYSSNAKGEKKRCQKILSISEMQTTNHSVTIRTRMGWAMRFLSVFHCVSLPFLKAHGFAFLQMYPSGITCGRQNTGHLNLICQAVNFNAKEPAVTTIFACLGAVRVTASTQGAAS